MKVLKSWKLVKTVYKVGVEGDVLEGYQSSFMGAQVVMLDTKRGLVGIGLHNVELIGEPKSHSAASIPCS